MLQLAKWEFGPAATPEMRATLRDPAQLQSLLEEHAAKAAANEPVAARDDITDHGERASARALAQDRVTLAHVTPLLGASQDAMSGVTGALSCAAPRGSNGRHWLGSGAA